MGLDGPGRGPRGGPSRPGPGRCTLIPSTPLTWEQLPTAVQIPRQTGADGPAGRTGLRMCNEGSCPQWAGETLLGLIHGCSAKGTGGLGLGHLALGL